MSCMRVAKSFGFIQMFLRHKIVDFEPGPIAQSVASPIDEPGILILIPAGP